MPAEPARNVLRAANHASVCACQIAKISCSGGPRSDVHSSILLIHSLQVWMPKLPLKLFSHATAGCEMIGTNASLSPRCRHRALYLSVSTFSGNLIPTFALRHDCRHAPTFRVLVCFPGPVSTLKLAMPLRAEDAQVLYKIDFLDDALWTVRGIRSSVLHERSELDVFAAGRLGGLCLPP